MCIKVFNAFSCGHASVPDIVHCAFTNSDATFVPCSLPRDVPYYLEAECPACARARWNKIVLQNERDHCERHEAGICSYEQCGIAFTAAERAAITNPGAHGLRETEAMRAIQRDYEKYSTDPQKIQVSPQNGTVMPYYDMGYERALPAPPVMAQLPGPPGLPTLDYERSQPPPPTMAQLLYENGAGDFQPSRARHPFITSPGDFQPYRAPRASTVRSGATSTDLAKLDEAGKILEPRSPPTVFKDSVLQVNNDHSVPMNQHANMVITSPPDFGQMSDGSYRLPYGPSWDSPLPTEINTAHSRQPSQQWQMDQSRNMSLTEQRRLEHDRHQLSVNCVQLYPQLGEQRRLEHRRHQLSGNGLQPGEPMTPEVEIELDLRKKIPEQIQKAQQWQAEGMRTGKWPERPVAQRGAHRGGNRGGYQGRNRGGRGGRGGSGNPSNGPMVSANQGNNFNPAKGRGRGRGRGRGQGGRGNKNPHNREVTYSETHGKTLVNGAPPSGPSSKKNNPPGRRQKIKSLLSPLAADFIPPNDRNWANAPDFPRPNDQNGVDAFFGYTRPIDQIGVDAFNAFFGHTRPNDQNWANTPDFIPPNNWNFTNWNGDRSRELSQASGIAPPFAPDAVVPKSFLLAYSPTKKFGDYPSSPRIRDARAHSNGRQALVDGLQNIPAQNHSPTLSNDQILEAQRARVESISRRQSTESTIPFYSEFLVANDNEEIPTANHIMSREQSECVCCRMEENEVVSSAPPTTRSNFSQPPIVSSTANEEGSIRLKNILKINSADEIKQDDSVKAPDQEFLTSVTPTRRYSTSHSVCESEHTEDSEDEIYQLMPLPLRRTLSFPEIKRRNVNIDITDSDTASEGRLFSL